MMKENKSIIEIIDQCIQKGIQLWTEEGKLHFKSPAGAFTEKLKAQVVAAKPELIAYLEKQKENRIQHDEKKHFEPFSVTDIQASYIVGRNKAYSYGGVGCKVYAEFLTGFTNEEMFLQAVNALVKRHAMLQVRINQERKQYFLQEFSKIPVRVYDKTNAGLEEQKTIKKRLREELQFKQYDPQKDALYELVLCILNSREAILYLSLDMIIGDFVSLDILVKDLERLYAGETLEPLAITFRDYIVYQEKQKKSMEYQNRYQADKKYWLDRIEQLPQEPKLPKAEREEQISTGTFYHKEYLVERNTWDKIVQLSKEYAVTPSSVILTIYGEVLKRWSQNKNFLINITTLSRPEVHQQISEILGDFTTTTLFEIGKTEKGTFFDMVKANQNRLFEDLSHNTYNGVEVIRELKRRNRETMIPYVFTSTLGAGSEQDALSKMHLLYKISQTPQVLIDCQLSRQAKGVLINWDVRAGVYEETMIEDMFEVFQHAIDAISQGKEQWEKELSVSLPDKTARVRKQVNETYEPFEQKNLITDIFDAFQRRKEGIALITQERKFTYQELESHVAFLQEQLQVKNMQQRDKVGILLGKGIWQIAAALAIVASGGVYVPIDKSQPVNRIEKILEQADIKICIGKPDRELQGVTFVTVPEEPYDGEAKKAVCVETAKEELAYIIFTSGSTGTPKGVEMAHGAAKNTIQDMIKKFDITQKDAVLGVSNLYFDLSVFDIFATLSAGGTLVLPDEEKKRDVQHWMRLCTEHNVTILNMVPAQMEMLMAYMETQDKETFQTLRLVLMSGDWIPVKLVRKIHARYPSIACIGLGGATEAGIWSIYYDTKKVTEQDKNVPYGIPLANQRFYVIDEQNQPCPDYVIGEICIAGDSLANGYCKDPVMTEEKFHFLDTIQEKIYRTGDLGKYRPDGVIEFIGRKDTQVKVNGYRVELGEIESALNSHPKIEQAVVLKGEDSNLTAFVKAKETEAVKEHFAKRSMIEQEERNLGFDKEQLEQWITLGDKTALMYIIKTMQELNIFTVADQRYSFSEIKEACHLKPTYEQLVARWLHVLTQEQWIQEENGSYYVTEVYDQNLAEQTEQEWREADRKIQYSDTMMAYMHDCAIQLKEVLSGKVHPHNLLFPQGDLKIARAAYKENVVARNLDQVTKNQVLHHVKEVLKKKDKVRILEVGAGLGSISLIQELAAYPVEYYFTDVSNFFFHAAKERLSGYDWVTYQIYDINKSNWEQGFDDEMFDSILCMNVLHNAKNINDTIKNLKSLLTADGELAMIEEVVKRHALLTSVEFEFAESAQTYTDGRDIEETIFLTENDWNDRVKQQNGEMIFTYPKEKDVLYPAGQSLMIAKFHKGESLTKDAAKTYLESKVPDYMIPPNFVMLHEFPLSKNGKIDRKALLEAAKPEKQAVQLDVQEELNDLEQRIQQIWCEVIGREKIGKRDDFYSVGGDSLLISQVTSKMLQELPEAADWDWDKLMLELMKNATVEKIAKRLEKGDKGSQKEKEREQEQASCLVRFVEPEGKIETAKVLFHAGTGTLSSYKELLPYLAENRKPQEALYGFNFGSEQAYLEKPVNTLLVECARKYADILAEQNVSQYEVIGYCVGGWIALEAAKALVERGKKVHKVTIISSSLCGHNFDNDILLERAFGLSIGADVAKAGYVGDNEVLQNALSQLKEEYQDGIPMEILCQLDGEYKEIGLGFQKLHAMTQSERLKKLYETLPDNEEAGEESIQMFEMLYRLFSHSFKGVMHYEPSGYVGDVHALFVEDDTKHFFPVRNISNEELWNSIVLGDLTIDYIPGEHGNCLKEPNVSAVAKLI